MKKLIYLITVFCILIIACNNNEEKQENNDTIGETVIDSPQNKISDNATKETSLTEIKKLLKQEDEELVFSFKTKKGKTMNIVLQKDNKYMAYRFGTEDNVELQFPEKLENTFEQFTYSYYFRGGGAMNSGLDLNYLSFVGETHKFVIFDEWSADESENEEGTTSVGIKIIDLTTKKEVVIEGINSTVKGSLVDFRDNGLVKVEEAEM